MRTTRLTIAIAGAVVAGGAVVALLVGAGATFAASPTPSVAPAATAAATSAPQAAASNAPYGGRDGGPGGHVEAVSDESVIANAIGISVSDLQTALANGQTVAQVARAHNVDPQKVIDALVTDGLNELAAEVNAGTITQAQADAQKAAVTQRATDQVNGTFNGGAGCPGGTTH
jgi:pyruvate/2-oxoglutarate dehydrogenase complex dihydrolipoamide acyltransferase (E2) component